MLVTMTFFQQQIMLAKKAAFATSQFLPISVGLYTNPYTPVRGSVISNFVEPTVPGYSRQVITFPTAPYLNTAGFWQLDPTNAIFQPTSIVPAQQIYGYFVSSFGLVISMMWAELNPAGAQPWGGNLIPFIVTASLQESQWNSSSP